MEAAIKTEGLTKTYGKNRGIRDVDLEVVEGEGFGFLGPNGAGKTTTIRTLLGFMRPTDGRAEVFGLDTQRQSVEVRARVGNLPGEFALEDRTNGEDLLGFFARRGGVGGLGGAGALGDGGGGEAVLGFFAGLRGVGSLGYARELAERFGADLHRPMRRLSRGNKQKIGLIQAMFHRPPLLILDEPTGGLDPLGPEGILARGPGGRAAG